MSIEEKLVAIAENVPQVYEAGYKKGKEEGGSVEGAVLYTAQDLTPEQQAQARENIGALGMSVIPTIKTRNIMPTNFENAIINSNGFWSRTDGLKYAASPDFVEVVGGETYTFSCDKSTWYINSTLYVWQYDADKNYITEITTSSLHSVDRSVTLESNCAYVRISTSTWIADVTWETLVPEKFQMEQGTVATEYTPPEIRGFDAVFANINNKIDAILNADYLYGKTLVACGDSITAAYNLGTNSGYIQSYAELTAKRHGMTFVKNTVSGSTMAYNADGDASVSTSAFSNTRYLNLPKFDYLTIWFGWNDHAYSTVGTIEDTDNTTFYGAYKIVLEHLITNNPTKKIGLVVPYGPNTEKMLSIAQAVRELSNRYGVPCLDLWNYNECSLIWGVENEAQTARRSALTFDTTHPNEAGHAFISTMYEAFLKRL